MFKRMVSYRSLFFVLIFYFGIFTSQAFATCGSSAFGLSCNVTNANDSGPGSLRAVLSNLCSNTASRLGTANTINLSSLGSSARINLLSPINLEACRGSLSIEGSQITIDSSRLAAGTCALNINSNDYPVMLNDFKMIGAASVNGVCISASSENRISHLTIENHSWAIHISNGNSNSLINNQIIRNSAGGIFIEGTSERLISRSNIIQGNFIGVRDGAIDNPLANTGPGILLGNFVRNTIIGKDYAGLGTPNTIRFNGNSSSPSYPGQGIVIDGQQSYANFISSNVMGSNVGPAIYFTEGSNASFAGLDSVAKVSLLYPTPQIMDGRVVHYQITGSIVHSNGTPFAITESLPLGSRVELYKVDSRERTSDVQEGYVFLTQFNPTTFRFSYMIDNTMFPILETDRLIALLVTQEGSGMFSNVVYPGGGIGTLPIIIGDAPRIPSGEGVTDLRLSFTESPVAIQGSFQDNMQTLEESSFLLERATGVCAGRSNSDFIALRPLIPSHPGVSIHGNEMTRVSFEDSNMLMRAQTYCYRVRAVVVSGVYTVYSGYSEAVEITLGTAPLPPITEFNTQTPTRGLVRGTFTHPVTGAVYELKRAVVDSLMSSCGSAITDDQFRIVSVSFSPDTLVPNRYVFEDSVTDVGSYCYKVRATRGMESTPWVFASSVVTVAQPLGVGVDGRPSRPGNLVASLRTNLVTLSFVDQSSVESGFQVMRAAGLCSATSSFTINVCTRPASSPASQMGASFSCEDSNPVQVGQSYCYRVIALDPMTSGSDPANLSYTVPRDAFLGTTPPPPPPPGGSFSQAGNGGGCSLQQSSSHTNYFSLLIINLILIAVGRYLRLKSSVF